MAIVQNFWLKGAKKRLAGAVLYEAMGQTRARELATEVSNPRTLAQMTQRIKWSNLVNFYKANASWMKYAFETKKSNQSEYNKFMSLNVTASRIALTKQAAAAGACVSDTYLMTQGTLPSIEWQISADIYTSNIYTAEGFTLDENTRVNEFSNVLIANNPAIQAGDQLSFIRINQMVNASTGYPYIIVRKYEVVMSTSNTARLSDYWPVELLTSENIGELYTLNVSTKGRKGGFIVILSRTVGGKTYVSTQRLINVNNEVTISAWSDNAAVQAAIKSYGDSTDAFLSSKTAGVAEDAPVGNSILSATINGGPYVPGQQTPIFGNIDSETFELVFSQALESSQTVLGVTTHWTNFEHYPATNGTITGGILKAKFPQVPQGAEDAHLLYIDANIDGQVYEIRFASANSYTIQGLE